MMRKRLLLLGVGAVFGSLPVNAHHSFTATYAEDTTETVEGELVQFVFRNPHSFVHIDHKTETGEVVRYAIEWAAIAQLNREGVTRDTLKPGDHLVVTGNPGRNPADHRLRMRTLTRPADGWQWGGTFE